MSVRPPTYTGTELDLMRAGFALAVILTLDVLQVFGPEGGRSQPVGLARLVDLQWLVRRRNSLRHAAQVAVVAYVLDIGTIWALLYLSAYLVLQVTADSSDGSINHGHHLVTVVAVAQLVAAGCWNASRQWGWEGGQLFGATRGATLAWWSVQVILAVYLTSGLAKLLGTRAGWVSRSPGLLVAAAARVDTHAAMGSRFQSAGTRRAQRLIAAMFPHPAVARLVFGAGLLVELAAPLGLLGEQALLVVGVALLALHQANRILLNLAFPTYQVLVLAYCVNLPRLWA